MEPPQAVCAVEVETDQAVHRLLILNSLEKLFLHMQERKGYTEQSLHKVKIAYFCI